MNLNNYLKCDTYERRILKNLEKDNEEQKELEHIVEAELCEEIVKRGMIDLILMNESFYSSKLSGFSS